MKRVLSLVLLLVISVQADEFVWDHADSLGGTVGAGYQDDTITISGALSVGGSQDALMVIAASGVLLRGVGGDDTLFYGTSGGNGVGGYGAINVGAAGDNFSITDLVVVHDPGNDGFDLDTLSTGVTNNTLLRLNSPDGVRLKRFTGYVFGDNALVVDCQGGSGTATENVVIDSSHFYNYCDRFTSRASFDGAAVRLELRGTYTGADFACSISNSVVHIAPQQGIAVFGRQQGLGVQAQGIWIYNCTTYVDARNATASEANQYGININGARNPIRIHHNYVGAGTKYGGSRGIVLQDLFGTSSDSVQVDSNTVEIWCGPDDENGNGVARGLRVRNISPGGYWDYINVFDNHIEITTDTVAATTHIGTDGFCINLGIDVLTDGYANGRIYGNTFVYRSLSGAGTNGVAGHYGCDVDYTTGSIPLVIQGNTYQSDDAIVWMADDYNGYPGGLFTLLEDTLEFLPAGDSGTNLSDKLTWKLGENNGNALGDSYGINCYYDTASGARDTNISFFGANTNSMVLTQRIPIAVFGELATPDSLIDTFRVIAISNFANDTVFDTTIGSGTTLDFPYWKTYGTGAGSDSNWNPYDITIMEEGVDTVVWTDTTIDWTITCLNFRLDGSRGTLNPDDSCAVSSPAAASTPTTIEGVTLEGITIGEYNERLEERSDRVAIHPDLWDVVRHRPVLER